MKKCPYHNHMERHKIIISSHGYNGIDEHNFYILLL